MRILFITNHYPPDTHGGYDQLCQEVALELAKRRHQVCVLTSKSAFGNLEDKENGIQIYRKLYLEVGTTLKQTALCLLKDRHRLEYENLQHVYTLVSSFKPEIALVWGMWNVPRSVPALLERLLPGRVAYYICDYWLTLPNAYIQRWQEPSTKKITRLPKRLLAKFFLANLMKEPIIELKLEHPICVSQAVREILVQTGVPVGHARVIHNGIELNDFLLRDFQKKQATGCLNLIYMGRLAPEKGVHTVIKAIDHLNVIKNTCLSLNIYGRGDSTYVTYLLSLVENYNLGDLVFFRGLVPRHQVPKVLTEHDVLIFPSEWQEPSARIVMEAMAVGLVVVGTTTGGTGEILVDNKTGLTFPPGDPEQLATQIKRLSQDPSLKNMLANTGQRYVTENFSLSRMVDQIEGVLFDLTSMNNIPEELLEKVV